MERYQVDLAGYVVDMLREIVPARHGLTAQSITKMANVFN